MTNNKLFNFIVFVSGIFLIYHMFHKQIETGIDASKQVISAPLAPAPKNQFVTESIDTDEKKGEGNYLERKIAGIMASFVETPQGKQFLSSMIDPKGAMHFMNIDQTLTEMPPFIIEHEILDYGNESVSCGDQVQVYHKEADKIYDITLGEHQIEPYIDAAIAMMREGEERKITLYNGKKFTLKLNQILKKANNHKILSFYKLPGKAKLACGMEILADIAIIDQNANELYRHSTNNSSNKEDGNKDNVFSGINLKIDKSNIPEILLNAVIKSGLHNTVTVILTKKDIATISKYNNFQILSNFKNNDFLALEITLLNYAIPNNILETIQKDLDNQGLNIDAKRLYNNNTPSNNYKPNQK